MMFEIPSNALLADEFLDMFDGFSIGSNDMTQLTLGLDRDSAIVASLFDERDPAVKKMLSMAISTARAKGKYIGICGQGPSDHPDLAQWLMEQGRSEEHTSELQSLMRISYAVFCLKKKKKNKLKLHK